MIWSWHQKCVLIVQTFPLNKDSIFDNIDQATVSKDGLRNIKQTHKLKPC